MRRFVLVPAVIALSLLSADSALAGDDGGVESLEDRVKTLLDTVADLRKEVIDLEARLSKFEAGQGTAPKREQPAAADRGELVEVVLSARTIPAYTRITRDHVYDATKKGIATIELRRGDVVEGMFTKAELPHLLGRVLRREKPPAYAFTAAELYPPGTRPGPGAGVPPEKRAVRIRAADIPDLQGLAQFDRFDLLWTVTGKDEATTARADGTGSRREGVPSDAGTPSPPGVPRTRVEVRRIVGDGLVVHPATVRTQVTPPPTLLWGAKPTMAPIEEVIVAVDPGELANLNLALALKARLQVAIRSGQPSDGAATEGVVPEIGWLVVRPELIERSRSGDAGMGGSAPEGGVAGAPPEAAGVYVLDRRASTEAMLARAVAGTDDAERASAQERAEAIFAGAEMTLVLDRDGTFATRVDRGSAGTLSAGGTWVLVGEHVELVTRHEDVSGGDLPDDVVRGRYADGRLVLHRTGEDFVVVLLRRPK